MNEKITRLPIQHRTRPHCRSCGRDLPVVNHVNFANETTGFIIEAVTIHMICPCGARGTVRRYVK